MSPLWGYVGSLVHWFIEMMNLIRCAPLERLRRYSIDISFRWSENLLYTCRPAGALGYLVADILYTYRPAGAMG